MAYIIEREIELAYLDGEIVRPDMLGGGTFRCACCGFTFRFDHCADDSVLNGKDEVIGRKHLGSWKCVVCIEW